ncbi:tryptophan 7-halogenase [Trichocoleus desertorum AS-A10]|uniref:flavin-dependent monooxygenase QhpG n=1 Tax=Trichocoleus desertorum TaxID=1481672 RepID=UPI00329712FD
MDSLIEAEVCVVGGGPSGSTIARKLALLGHQVCLLEKATFPRSHIGESFPPTIMQVLDLLGVRQQVEAAGFFRPTQSLIRWATPEAAGKTQPGDAGLQVDRGQFDQLLLEAAQAVGVQVLQPAHAGRPSSHGKYQWTVPVYWRDRPITINAQFLIDATGKHRSPGRPKQHHPIATLALYGYWRDTPFRDCGSRVEAGSEEWFWGAPLPDGRFNAAVFLDAERYTKTKVGRKQWYRELLSKTTLLRDCLQGQLDGPVQVCDASGYLNQNPIGLDWINVGDAAFAIDPLSSQGVQMAMMSAFQGSIVVHTLLAEPASADAAIAFYRNKLQETVTRSQRTAAQIYATQSLYPMTPFWEQRSQLIPDLESVQWERNTAIFNIDSPIRLSQAAKLMQTPVIQHDSVRWLNALHHPSLDNPVAYLGDLAIAPLLNELTAEQTVVELMQRWSNQHNLSTCWQLLQWFWSNHIILNSCP